LAHWSSTTARSPRRWRHCRHDGPPERRLLRSTVCSSLRFLHQNVAVVKGFLTPKFVEVGSAPRQRAMVASHFQPLPMMETPLWCSSSNANRTNSFPIRSSCPLPASIASRGGGREHTTIPFQALGFESCSCKLDRFMSVFKGVSCSRRS
jgi:hypothetical protein